MFNKDDILFVGFRVEDHPTPNTAGSTKAACVLCGAEIWVSPASQPVMEKATKVVCMRCAPVATTEDKVQAPTPEQLVEVATSLLPDAVKTMREVAKKHPWEALRAPLRPPPARYYRGLGQGLQVGFTFDVLPGFCTEHLSVAWKEREPDLELMKVIVQGFFGEEKELLAEIHKWPMMTVYHFHKIVRSAS